MTNRGIEVRRFMRFAKGYAKWNGYPLENVKKALNMSRPMRFGTKLKLK